MRYARRGCPNKACLNTSRDFYFWPSTAASAGDRRDGFRGYFRRAFSEVAGQLLTPSGHEHQLVAARQMPFLEFV
jgi:hypothetical protein